MQTNFDKHSVKNPSLEIKSKEHYDFIGDVFDSYIKFDDFMKRKDLFVVVSRNTKNEIIGLTLVRETLINSTIKVKKKVEKDKNGKPKTDKIEWIDKITGNFLVYRVIYTLINKHYRGKGYNQILLDFLYQHAKSVKNVKYITANIRESNKTSTKSFLKNGFKISNRITKPYKNDEKKIRVIKFIK